MIWHSWGEIIIFLSIEINILFTSVIFIISKKQLTKKNNKKASEIYFDFNEEKSTISLLPTESQVNSLCNSLKIFYCEKSHQSVITPI